MAKTAEVHYDDLLGPIYTWMVGDVDAAFARGDTELDALALSPTQGATAIDVGAGYGLHAIPLARRGYSVLALDSCDELLKDLRKRAGSLPIRIVNANLLEFKAHIAARADVILCMGDTLTHLPDHSSVQRLFQDAAASLMPGGMFVATFRDYVSAELADEARFIPVRSDAERILTCFLEYKDTTVIIHDLLYRHDGGAWRLHAGSYAKLRLAPLWVMEQLSSLGLAVVREAGPGGMIRIVARKAPVARAGATQ